MRLDLLAARHADSAAHASQTSFPLIPPSHNMSSPISNLPVELQREVASYLAHLTPYNPHQSLAALSLVSRSWNAAATISLYSREVELGFVCSSDKRLNNSQHPACQFARTLQSRQDFAALVTEITVEIDTYDDYYLDMAMDGSEPYKEDVKVVVDALRTVIKNGPNVVKLTLRSRDWMVEECLEVLHSNSESLQRLAYLEVDNWAWTEEVQFAFLLFLASLPSLAHLRVEGFFASDPDYALVPPVIALETLATRWAPEDHIIRFLAASPTRLSLQSLDFSTHRYLKPSWAQFPNLHSITFSFGDAMERELVTETLATCVAAKTIRLQAGNFTRDLFEDLAYFEVLHSIPSGIVHLDLSSTDLRHSDYFLDWIRNGDERWPNLRKITLCILSRYTDAVKEEYDRAYKECEEVCERRGIECRKRKGW